MELERVRMRMADWWEGGSSEDRKRKVLVIGACVLIPLALILIIWNLSGIYAGPIRIEADPAEVAATQATAAELAALAGMSEAELNAEVTKRRAAYRDAEKTADPAAMQAAHESLERALEALDDVRRKAAAGG